MRDLRPFKRRDVTIRAAFSGNVESDKYFAGFAAYYDAGLDGNGMDNVNGEYASTLNDAQKFAAYTAGENDAKIDEGTDHAKSGLYGKHYTHVAQAFGNQTAEAISKAAKLLGVRVLMADEVAGGIANAELIGNDVIIEKDNPNPLRFLYGHEITHRMQKLAPEQYKQFKDFIHDEIKDEASAMKELYASRNVNLSDDEALDEVAANYAGRLIEGGDTLERFIERNSENKTLLQEREAKK